MASDGWAQAVREQLGPGRLLPLGAPADGAWITEQAAVRVLAHAAVRVPGVRPGAMRLGLAKAGSREEPVVPPPLGALPPGPLVITAEFGASTARPLPESAEQLRRTLLAAAGGRLGLRVAEVDLHITELLDEHEESGHGHTRPEEAALASHPHRHARGGNGHGAHDGEGAPAPHGAAGRPDRPGPDITDRLAVAAATVPGVERLASGTSRDGETAVVEGVRFARALTVDDRPGGRHVEVRLALAPGHRALDVTRAVRAAVAVAARRGAPGPVTVTALVTSMGEDD
ncbi:hypothetical protein [Streptomyces meridianus]|uniref:Nucleopolyhedrovirus P10 family protein n=1 Tax=Streptomyces meridianus TaxID=2938945 RepID=A0ABT0X733_9ACTN|nr:hypothetical protein [Streptomyces meridianus]MCM2577517.1 hypothetical protein [Streptomyces meridianus]